MVSFRIFALAVVVASTALSDRSAAQQVSSDALDVVAYLDLLDQAQARSTAKDWTQAAELWTRAVTLNPVDVKLWTQLATARQNARDFAGAIAAYENMLEMGADLPSVPAYNIACCHALAGDKEAAIEWLDKSFRAGFRAFDRAQTDADLVSLHDDPRFGKLVALPDSDKISRDERWRFDLALLVREVKRRGYDPFRRITSQDFAAAAKQIEDSIPNLTDVQILIEMTKLMREVGDGHSGIVGALQPAFAQSLPMQFYFFKEGLYVIAVDPKYREMLGAEILRFEDRTVPDVMAALDPLIHRDNDVWPVEVGPYQMRFPAILNGLGLIAEPQQVTFGIRCVDGTRRTKVVPAQAGLGDIWNKRPHPKGWVGLPETLSEPLPLYLKNRATSYWFEHLHESRVVYCQYNRILNDRDESLAEFTKRLFQSIDDHEVDKLVIDLRWNNGGNTFLNEAFLHRLIGCTKVNQRGKLFVIIGRRTFSAAQNAATSFERHTEAIFVGEPTGSSPNFIGEGITFKLPYSKAFVSLSDLYWQTGWPKDHRKWIAPLLYTPPSFAAYRVNRDPAMEAILEYPAGR